MSTEDTKAAVAKIGVGLMNKNGFGPVTMTQIEEAAFPTDGGPDCEPADGRIYQVFVSKEDLALYWMVRTMTESFDEVERAMIGFERKTVKFFLQTLFETWIQCLTRRRVFVEGLVRSMIATSALERRFLDEFADDTHQLIQSKFIGPFQGVLSIPNDDEHYGEKQAVLLMQAALGLVTVFWIQDRSMGFENSYRMADAVTDILCATIAEGSGGAINGLMSAASEIRKLAESQITFDVLSKLVPTSYLEGLPWNLVKVLYGRS